MILLAVLQGLVQEAQWSLGIKLCCIVEGHMRRKLANEALLLRLVSHYQQCINVENVEKLIEQQEAEAFFEGAWEEDIPAIASTSDEASGRIDGTLPSLQSGEGNVPLHLKFKLAHALGSFTP